MNLLAIPVDHIPLNRPLPWPLYDIGGGIVYRVGEVLTVPAMAEGLYRDAAQAESWDGDTPPPHETFPPEGIKPQIGGKLQLQVRGRQLGCQARLIGYMRNASLLVTHPVVAGERIALAEGEQVEARILAGRHILVFDSVVARICISPLHYLHLDYPARVFRQLLRNSPWCAVNLLTVATNAAGVSDVGRIVNLSFGGAKLEIAAHLGKPGDRIELVLKVVLDELKASLTLPALIRHIGRPGGLDSASDAVAYGVEFAELDGQAALWLKCLVYQHIAEGLQI